MIFAQKLENVLKLENRKYYRIFTQLLHVIYFQRPRIYRLAPLVIFVALSLFRLQVVEANFLKLIE